MLLRDSVAGSGTLSDCYSCVRDYTVALCQPLATEDYSLQLMDNVSPPKWHLAHTSWFFETFILVDSPAYKRYHELFQVLFNSYYEGVGRVWPRTLRGSLSRPTIDQVMEYRSFVDRHMLELLASKPSEQVCQRVILGLHHEQQHQELLLTDIKYNLSQNPLNPAYRNTPSTKKACASPLQWREFEGGLKEVGCAVSPSLEYRDFVYDNETPRHRVYVEPYRIASRLVTNGEYLEFIADDGYQRPELWLSDGWSRVLQENWHWPLYWREKQDECPFPQEAGRRRSTPLDNPVSADFREYHLDGLNALDPDAPVCHVSFYEADAYARWKNLRLPSESEWELAALELSAESPKETLSSGSPALRPTTENGTSDHFFGGLWQWTSSSYSPYPGFRPFAGQPAEYNGKFMCSQQVLRGSSFATPRLHSRTTYRNFFYPQDRWQFTGIRLAGNADV